MSLRRNIYRGLKARLHSGKCQRCPAEAIAGYLVSSDVINMKVCAHCAEEARRLGLIVKHIRRFSKAA